MGIMVIDRGREEKRGEQRRKERKVKERRGDEKKEKGKHREESLGEMGRDRCL